MNHMASFGILLRKDDKNKKHKEKEDIELDSDLPPVHYAAATGNIEELTKLIKDDPDLLEMKSPDGLSPLGQAVLCQQLDSVKYILQQGANIDTQDNTGRTCLSIAAYQGWHDGVLCLLKHGAKQNICDKSGRYPLHAATYHSDINTMELLLQGLTTKEVNMPDHEMMTAVHWAAFHDRPDHLMHLIQKGGDILAKDVDGKLPLHWAAQNNSFQCVHRLTSMNEGLVTVNDVDQSGKSPAHYAAASGAFNIIKILARCENINLELEDPDERTPLHWAAAVGHPRTVDTLLRVGVNPYPTDVDGCTPLDYALQTEHEDCVKAMKQFLGSADIKKHKEGYMVSMHGTHDDVQELSTHLKYRFRRPSHGEHGRDSHQSSQVNTHDVPEIVIQAPTLSKGSTHPNIPGPRMYSASTDTDYDHQQRTSQSPITARDVDYAHHEQVSWKDTKPNKSPGGALGRLIGSSFAAAVQTPMMVGHGQDESGNGGKRQGSSHEASVSKPGSHTRHKCDDQSSRWATQAPHPASHDAPGKSGKEEVEPKAMTSTNTPDLNRVSVQSFRSIPPILSGKAKEGTSARRRINQVSTIEQYPDNENHM